MRLAVLGASGGCGSWLVDLAVQRGHNVTAVVRPSSAYSPPSRAELVTGQVTNPGFVETVVREHDVVLSCLGLRRAGLSPWAPLRSPPDLVQRVTSHLVGAMIGAAIERIVWISAGGVAESRTQVAAPIRAVIRSGSVRTAYDDLEQAESLIPPRDGRWLAVRPVTLMNGSPTGRAGEVERYGLFSIIRRADVACWMLDVATGERPFEGPAVLLGTVQ